MILQKVKILRPFYCSLPGGNGRDVRPGDEVDIPARLVDTLSSDGYVEALKSMKEPEKADVVEIEQPKEEAKPIAAPPAPPQPLAAAPRPASKAPQTLNAPLRK